MIKLRCNDGIVSYAEYNIAKNCSGTIRMMLESLEITASSNVEIPLPNVNSYTLRKVLMWAKHHKDDLPAPAENDDQVRRTDDISAWDAQFLKVDQANLFEIIVAANYLDVPGLVDVGCKTVANMIKGRTPEEIRKTFNIEKDLDPEDEEQIRKENQWCQNLEEK